MQIRDTTLAIALVLCGALVLTGCSRTATATPSTPAAAADYPSRESIDALVDAADAIIVGDVVSTETREINISLEADREENPMVFPYAVSSLRVRRVIKGDLAEGDLVEVKQLVEADESEGRLRVKGTRGVLFLQAYTNNIPYSLVSPQQGVLVIQNGKTIAGASNKLFKSPRAESDVIGELEGLAR